MNTESESYWSERYVSQNIPWDAGDITTPLKEYIDSLEDTSQRILIPGAGNGYEAEYLHKVGFSHVYVADISPFPLQNLKKRCPDFPDDHLLGNDFFDLAGEYDLILEQTFFCALPPARREEYVKKCISLLVPGGKLVGVLFDDPLNDDFPPYGGNLNIYKSYFLPSFEPQVMDRCYNSIPPRAGRELFIILQKPFTS
jgi:thiopurine S-methyltransferase